MHKIEGPNCCLTFLGFELESKALEIRLPLPKLEQLQILSQIWATKGSCMKRELECRKVNPCEHSGASRKNVHEEGV